MMESGFEVHIKVLNYHTVLVGKGVRVTLVGHV